MFWHWIRRQYRLIARPVLPEKEANKWYSRSTVAYLLSCWTLFGVTFYHYMYTDKSKTSTEVSSAEYFGPLLGAKRMEVIHMKGISKVGESIFDLEEYNKRLQEQKNIKDKEFFGVTENEAMSG